MNYRLCFSIAVGAYACTASLSSPTARADGFAETFDFGVPDAVVDFDDRRPIFALHTAVDKNDPGDRVLEPKDFARFDRQRDGERMTLRWAAPPEPWPDNLQVTVTLESVPIAIDGIDHEIQARIAIEHPGGIVIRKVRFPAVYAQPDYHYDTLLMSHTMGDAMFYPQRVIGGRLGGECVYRYPAQLSMQYMIYYNEARSFYVSAYATPEFGETFEHSARNWPNGMRLSCVWYPFLEKGKWQSPVTGFTVYAGGWHKGADLYRGHMGKVFQPPEPPKWLRESFHGWMQVSFKGARKNPPFYFRDIPKLYETVAATGANVLHIFSWGQGGFDNNYPLRYPSPNNGTPEELRDAMDTVRAMGGHVVLYTNGRLIDPDTPWFAEIGHTAVARDKNGEPYVETYAGNDFYVADPSVPAFGDALFDNFYRMITDYHAQAAQIDQTGVMPAVFNYDTRYRTSSTPANNWLIPTDNILRRIHDFYRSRDPDFFVWGEGTNERFGRFYDVHEHHGESGWWTVGDSLPEQFRYTYPNFLLTGTCENIQQLCHTHGQGKPFDFRLSRMNNADFVGLLKKLIQVRKDEPAYFLRGIFRDTVGVEASGRDIRYWRIENPDKPGTLINVWARGQSLESKNTASVRLPADHRDWKRRTIYPDDLTIKPDGTWLTLSWTGPIATLAAEE